MVKWLNLKIRTKLPLDLGKLHFIGIGGIGMSGIAELIYKVIKGLSENKTDNSKIENEVKKEIINLCAAFPIYEN